MPDDEISLSGTDKIRIASDLEMEIKIEEIRKYVSGLMAEQISRIHEEAKTEVHYYDANVFKQQMDEQTERMIESIEMTQ